MNFGLISFGEQRTPLYTGSIRRNIDLTLRPQRGTLNRKGCSGFAMVKKVTSSSTGYQLQYKPWPSRASQKPKTSPPRLHHDRRKVGGWIPNNNQEPRGREPPSKKLYQVLRGGSSFPGSWLGNLPSRRPPRGRGFPAINQLTRAEGKATKKEFWTYCTQQV